MPNWCENRVRLSDNGNTEQFDRLCELLDGPDPFNAIFPRPDFPNIPNDKGELPIKEEIKNDKGEVVAVKLTTSQMAKMTIAGITGAATTGERSGICATNTQQKLMKVGQSLDLIPRGRHLMESLIRSKKISQMLVFHGSMMNPE